MKFNVDGVGTKQVVSAKLRLYCVDSSPTGGSFRKVLNNSWSEGTVTWNNAPQHETAVLASLGRVRRGNWYEVDVTSLITGDGTFSLKVVPDSTDGADYASRERDLTHDPQLILTVR